MKVKFWCDNAANIHSEKTITMDTEKDLGLDPGEWESFSVEEKEAYVADWANEQFSYGYEELP